jgi:hypothetical protein
MADHRKDLQKARETLATLLRKREEIEISIAKQRRKVAAWSELCEESEFSEAHYTLADLDGKMHLGGWSAACRTALRSAFDKWMTVSEIQERLRELGFPLDKYKAPAASITTTVNRLVEAGEVESRDTIMRGHEYRWRFNIPGLG